MPFVFLGIIVGLVLCCISQLCISAVLNGTVSQKLMGFGSFLILGLVSRVLLAHLAWALPKGRVVNWNTAMLILGAASGGLVYRMLRFLKR